jgi:hypothetical protein
MIDLEVGMIDYHHYSMQNNQHNNLNKRIHTPYRYNLIDFPIFSLVIGWNSAYFHF